MEWLIFPSLAAAIVGLSILIVKSDKAAIRRALALKEFELIYIRTSYNVFWRHFKYIVTYKTKDGIETQENCRVSFFLGVIWEDEDSFLKWLLP